LHPLESAALSRRTPKADINPINLLLLSANKDGVATTD
jgi:hypothetical protein